MTMPARAALLIRCSTEEAAKIRHEAAHEHRTIGGYVLNVLERSLQLEDSLFHKLTRFRDLNRVLSRLPTRAPGPRTAFLFRCSAVDAQRIRIAAERRQTTISGFVLHCIR